MRNSLHKRNKLPLFGKYLCSSFRLYFYLLFLDFIIKCLIPKITKNKVEKRRTPNSFLICNGAHLGDVLLSVKTIESIKRSYPSSKIGLLVGSWSRDVAINIPGIDYIHYVDHWRLSRKHRFFFRKVFAYLHSLFSAIFSIRKVNYDFAIDLYYFYPNSSLLLWFCGIPKTVGFNSGGCGDLYSIPVDWVDGRGHVTDYHKELLSKFNIPSVEVANYAFGNFPVTYKYEAPYGSYVIVHPGTSAESREWPISNWIELLTIFKAMNINVVITGKGRREMYIARQIIAASSWGENFVNSLDILDFITLIKKSNLLIGVESFAGHLAALLKTPFVVLKTGITSDQWAPNGSRGEVVKNILPCSPCHQGMGCKEMKCIRGISVDDVIKSVQTILC